MPIKVLLVTPPFTQLNTPYPATAYLKGFLNTQGVTVEQFDLSIELFNTLFTRDNLESLMGSVTQPKQFEQVGLLANSYLSKVDAVRSYLQCQDAVSAHRIVRPGFLPQGHRFPQEEDLTYAFGDLGIMDKAKHLATLFIEELGDYVQANIDANFGFNRYAERIARSASSFDAIEHHLRQAPNAIEQLMLSLFQAEVERVQPDLVGFTVPFPGNLMGALRCGQWIKTNQPGIKVAMGGGYCNTELRELTDPRVGQFVDFITLDDGEGPMLQMCQFLAGKISQDQLERTFDLTGSAVQWVDHQPNRIHHHNDLPAPDYSGLERHQYLSFLDVMNPMHRLWSDGRWNKMTIAHGCYWKQCSFCDVSLDYIGNYQPATAVALVDRMEQVLEQTGITGFHFVDEAAPPKAMKALAQEIINRGLQVTWWTNIRFEKTFDFELCQLLAESGCIAVTGGLEVASDRLLELMQKGVNIAQVANVTKAFSDSGIMVHAYLMNGFPTQTEQETIDALEVVRQLFENGCIHSGFWHQFAATAHSPIGQNPAAYQVHIKGPEFGGFAKNDLFHEDPTGATHDEFGPGLELSLHNYMNGVGFDIALEDWFEFDVPSTSLAPDYIATLLTN